MVFIRNSIDGILTQDQIGNYISLSADGSTLAISYRFPNTGVGFTRVFEYEVDDWIQKGDDIAHPGENPTGGDISMELSSDGTTLAIGASFYSGNPPTGFDNLRGIARVYQYGSGNWSQLGNDILGESAGDELGRSVSLSSDGTILAVGAIEHSTNIGVTSGQVQIFQYDSNNWVQLGDDIIGQGGDELTGFSIDLSSDGMTIAVGEPGNSESNFDQGRVRIFTYDSNNWVQKGTNINGSGFNTHLGVFCKFIG